MRLVKYIGRIAEWLNIKDKLILLYEKGYDSVKTIQMYFLLPLDILYRRKHSMKIMTLEETILYILEKECSVSRFGDGEFNLLSDTAIGFQNNNLKLVKGLREIVKSGGEKVLVCLPGIFSYEKEYERGTRRYFNKILVHKRAEWYSYCNPDYVYGNADITRCYIEFENRRNAEYYFSLLKQIWNNREIVIIEGEKSRLGIGNDLFDNASRISRILCPAINAYNVHDEILEYVVSKISKNKLLLLALGPTASVLAWEFSVRGYQAVDIGNIDKEYEWFQLGATSKKRNPLKFSMEVKDGINVQECTDNDYLKDIICKIGC